MPIMITSSLGRVQPIFQMGDNVLSDHSASRQGIRVSEVRLRGSAGRGSLFLSGYQLRELSGQQQLLQCYWHEAIVPFEGGVGGG
jgi:hypothetical protein